MDLFEKLEAMENMDDLRQELAMVCTVEELQQILVNHGVELTLDEVNALAAMASANRTEGELTDLELDHVVGGAMINWKANRLIKIIPFIPVDPIRPINPGRFTHLYK